MLSNWLQSAQSVESYSQLAFIYDYLMRHVNYRRWAQYLSDLFLKADVLVNEILDISCGTGNLLLQLVDLDYKVAGFDESENMIKMARLKADKKRIKIPVWCGSMTKFAVQKEFHAVICTYDSINYCLDLEACISTFGHSSKALCPGGLFIFDVCTLKNSRKNFQNY
ncbi:MAG: class I SAM-dependent DNA methyltransferase, partial [bacterium]